MPKEIVRRIKVDGKKYNPIDMDEIDEDIAPVKELAKAYQSKNQEIKEKITGAKVVEDERFLGKYNRQKFNSVDENGVPIFDSKGKRTFYSSDEGLSRLYLGRGLSLGSSDDDLADSDVNGRVVFVK